MNKTDDKLAGALRQHEREVREAIAQRPDWSQAAGRFDALFARIANRGDTIWSGTTMEELRRVYLSARERDGCSGNITLRTMAAMPPRLHNDTKKIFLQIAEACVVFNASHKVNFEAAEVPDAFPDVSMTAGKKAGAFTYAAPPPSLYLKSSLTFDYWVPKILDWTIEVRERRLTGWRGDAILEHDTCTDFMRVALLFLSDPATNPPLAKPDDREAVLTRVLGAPFVWIKKSQKREDIRENNRVMTEGLGRAATKAGLAIPIEAWGRLLRLPFAKDLLAK